jgi:hypothetical protein
MAHNLTFSLSVPADEYLKYYSGSAKLVHVRADNGQTIAFPAEKLLPFVEHAGIFGHFEISFDENNQFIALTKLNS